MICYHHNAEFLLFCVQNLVFTVGALQPQIQAVKFPGGAVSERIDEHMAGTGASLMPLVSSSLHSCGALCPVSASHGTTERCNCQRSIPCIISKSVHFSLSL